MRVLLATKGSRGDVEPILALAVQLQALGVEVRVCAPSDQDFVPKPRSALPPLAQSS